MENFGHYTQSPSAAKATAAKPAAAKPYAENRMNARAAGRRAPSPT
jgi:hypothetical protein